MDWKRVEKIKGLLYNIHKSNIGVLRVKDLQECMEDLISKASNGEFSTIIFDE